MTLYYLGIPVEQVGPDVPNEKGRTANSFGPGHENARWPDGKIWTHWYGQLTIKPWGHK
jgi:hypothetical protein